MSAKGTRGPSTLTARRAAHLSWAATADRSARTAAARKARADRFATQVDPDGTMDPKARALAAESARKAFYVGMAEKSVKARAAKKAAAELNRECQSSRHASAEGARMN